MNMKDARFRKALESIKEIKMTAVEKRDVYMRVSEQTNSFALGSLQNIWTARVGNILSQQYFRVAFSGALICVMVFSGGSAAVMAETSLPGDILYNLKVKVTEPIRDVFVTNFEDSAKWNLKKVERRVREFEALSANSRIEEIIDEGILTLLNSHIKSVKGAVSELRKDNKDDIADELSVNFEALMNAHARIIDAESSNDNQLSREARSGFAKKLRAKALELEEIDNDGGEVLLQSINVPNMSEGVSEVDRQFLGDFENSKKSINTIIESTFDDLNKFGTNTSTFHEKVAEDTHSALNDARSFLNQADANKEQNGYKATKSLIKASKLHAKEARIFLDESIKIEREKRRD